MSLLQDAQKVAVKEVPALKTGYTVRVHQKIKEGEKVRTQIFEGLIIKINSGYGADKSFTVRKVVEGIGVEKVFHLYSPLIEKIEIKKKSKVRRSKLYYMRERFGKSARLKESFVSEKELEESIEKLAAQKAKEDAENSAAAEAEAPKEDTNVEEAPKSEESLSAEAEEAKTPEPYTEEAPVPAEEEPKKEE